MEKTVRLNADQREDLVAYLDGELPDEQVQQIDQIIARSEVARHEVEALARTWELLDVLPAVKASDDFASKTMTSLKVMEQPFILSDQWWYVYVTRCLAIGGWIGAITVCGWLGFQVTRFWIPNPNEALLQNLPLIENLDQYQDAGDIEFLKLLKQSDLFDDTQEPAQAAR
jgi:hypothetical protein